MKITKLNLIVILLACSSYSYTQQSDFSVLSQAGNTLNISSLLSPLQINRIHSWELTLQDANGEPLVGAIISVVGGMPAHDHGLPTQPQVSQTEKAGVYLIEGIRFHMPGAWEMEFSIRAAVNSDSAKLEFSL